MRHAHVKSVIAALFLSMVTTSADAGCPECQDEHCNVITDLFGAVTGKGRCWCVARLNCVVDSAKNLGGDLIETTRNAAGDIIETVKKTNGDIIETTKKAGGDLVETVKKANGDVIETVKKAGGDIIETTKKAGGDLVETARKANGDVIETVRKAGGDIVETTKKAGGDLVETVRKANGDIIETTKRAGGDIIESAKTAGGDFVENTKRAGGDTIRTLRKAGGDTVITIQKAGEDIVKTTYKAAGDATANYVKAWKDGFEQSKRSFNDAVDAGRAVSRFVENEAKSTVYIAERAKRRLRDGKVIDAMWGLGTERLQQSEKNFAKATQESEVLNAAAAAAATTYGGPAGAAAYSAWSTYRRTGNADMALRAGLLAAATSQLGSSVARMPSGTTSEILKKSAMAGAAGGIAVAAAGGDEHAIKDGFLKSAGSVLVQGGTAKLKAYSPETADAYRTVQCISARDVDCLSNTTWAKDAKGKILTDKHGKPRVDPKTVDAIQSVGRWTRIVADSAEGRKNALLTQISKLPNSEAIPLMRNQWVLTSNLSTLQEGDFSHKKPTVVLTYVGGGAPFVSSVTYEGRTGGSKISGDTTITKRYGQGAAKIPNATQRGRGTVQDHTAKRASPIFVSKRINGRTASAYRSSNRRSWFGCGLFQQLFR